MIEIKKPVKTESQFPQRFEQAELEETKKIEMTMKCLQFQVVPVAVNARVVPPVIKELVSNGKLLPRNLLIMTKMIPIVKLI
mgnify:CR=1 FL=1